MGSIFHKPAFCAPADRQTTTTRRRSTSIDTDAVVYFWPARAKSSAEHFASLVGRPPARTTDRPTDRRRASFAARYNSLEASSASRRPTYRMISYCSRRRRLSSVSRRADSRRAARLRLLSPRARNGSARLGSPAESGALLATASEESSRLVSAASSSLALGRNLSQPTARQQQQQRLHQLALAARRQQAPM